MENPRLEIGQLVAGLLDDLDERYENAEILDAVILVEVLGPEGGDNAGSIVEYGCTTRRASVPLGLVEMAAAKLKAPYDHERDSPDEFGFE